MAFPLAIAHVCAVPSGPEMIILVTGSRDWDDPYPIFHILGLYAAAARAAREPLTIRHGDADGADAIADSWVRQHQALGWPVIADRHPAEWLGPCVPRCRPGHRRYSQRAGGLICPAAGIYRSEHMCDLDPCPQYVEAFLRGRSPGTTACAAYASRRRLPVERTVWEDRAAADRRVLLAGVRQPTLM